MVTVVLAVRAHRSLELCKRIRRLWSSLRPPPERSAGLFLNKILGVRTDVDVFRLSKRDTRRRRVRLRIVTLQDLGLAALHPRKRRVRGAKVNTVIDSLSHRASRSVLLGAGVIAFIRKQVEQAVNRQGPLPPQPSEPAPHDSSPGAQSL